MASADEALLDELHAVLESRWGDHADVAIADREFITLALSEIVSNIVQHGVGVSSATFEVEVTGDAVSAVVRDDGEPLDADVVERATWPDDPLAESGRGIVMARDALDTLRYERVDGTNVWTLVRRRDQGDG